MKQLNKTGLAWLLVSLGALASVVSYRAATINGAFLSNWSPVEGTIGMVIIFAVLIRLWMYNDVVLGEEKHDKL